MGAPVLGPTLIELDRPLEPTAMVGLGFRYRRANGGLMEEAQLVEYLQGICDALGIPHEAVVGFDDEKGLRLRVSADMITSVL